MLKLYPRGNSISYIVALLLPLPVFAQPVINSVTPASGPVNTTVTINGSNFSATPSANIVWFGSVRVPVTAASAGSLTVTVPTGTSSQSITVNTAGLTSFPFAPFTTTFTDNGQFMPSAFSARSNVPAGSGPQFICNADLDGDGKPDLVVANGDSNTVTIYHNNSTPGAVSFSEVASFTMGTNGYPIGVAAGDLDGDGKPDIVISNYYTQTLTILLNAGSPGNIVMDSVLSVPSGNYILGASIADLNGDGKPEMIVASQGSKLLSVYTNSSTPGHISFSNETPIMAPAGGSPFKVVVADLDGDGKPDLAAANSYAGTVSAYLNTSPTGGAISFAANVDFTTGNFPEGLAIGDIDGDGKPDLVVANNTDNTLSLLHNTSTVGSLSFGPQITVNSGSSAYDLVIADFDGDGKPDIAVVDQYNNTVSVHRNISTPGTIAISANVDYATGNIPYSITTADFDGDGKPDLATANDGDNTFTILRNSAANEPAITSFSPTTGAAGTVVTIVGVNLTGVSSVKFGDSTAASFTYVSPDTVTAVVGGGATGPVSLVAAAGATSLNGFIYSSSIAITGFTPDSAATGTLVTITGKGFTGSGTVQFGGTAAQSFTVLNDSTVTATVGIGASGPISITTPGGIATSTTNFVYIFTPLPPVVLTSFSPDSAGQGATVTITGQHLSGITAISFGGTPAQSFRIFSDSVVYVTVGPGSTGNLFVSGNNGTDSLPGFYYIAPPPPPPVVSITSFSPTTATNGTAVSIRGSNLTAVRSVMFGGTPAASYAAISDSLILAVVGTGSTGYVSVANSISNDSLPGFVYTYDTTRQSDTIPVFQLLTFIGAYTGGSPLLQWQTANDSRISYYALERETNDDQFEVIATILPIPNDSTVHSYSFSDAGHDPGTNHYRLRMQDSTAAYTYSNIIAVQLPVKPTILSVYPNPVIYGFTYVAVPDAGSNSEFEVVDMSGKAMKTQLVDPGTPQVRVDMSGLHPGTYKLIWTNGSKSAYQTVLVLSRF
ncbi:MAG TPA: FG-GAP-like repeat-containing protein [Puia sp.]|nr:FG-GAP-like repeat-containing protein [Puia sp.]